MHDLTAYFSYCNFKPFEIYYPNSEKYKYFIKVRELPAWISKY